ncbi:CRIB domain-containing protein RIC10-like isoform X2 [Phalaenopsis equestris]|uniref:CRIB domain-containing protein RIC10-like isoform X2 n=1 Tax=Phalaenopsis equestris TaxID=78828 RepID=UPI0009E364B8|nr:CRIB domain-containing protein RIC10-like isoform X2 [Phalaenopsis equestris]
MVSKMKGVFKGFKFISQIFVFKEPEMVIGYPTDVKHAAHIGFSSSSSIPSWMAEFNTASDFSSGVLGESRGLSWASHEFDQPNGFQLSPGKFSDKSCPEAEKVPKKKRKKTKFASSFCSSEQAQTVMA